MAQYTGYNAPSPGSSRTQFGTVSIATSPTAVQGHKPTVGVPAIALETHVAPNYVPANQKKRLSGVCGPGIGDEFFEKIYVLPRTIDAGIILSDLVYVLDLYSSYRKEDRSWTGYTDAALGTGVDIEVPVPPPTIVFPPQSGAIRELTIAALGPPAIDADITFTFDTGTVLLPVTGTRSPVFPFEPEDPLIEELAFLTDVLKARSGKEQRRALRKNPRSKLQFALLLEDEDLQKFENQMVDNHNRAFGIPLWHQTTTLTANVTALDTVINVGSTAYADYRVGGLVVVWNGPFSFEAQQIASFTGTTITVNSPFQGSFTAPARVMPVATCLVSSVIKMERWRTGLQRAEILAQVLDNDSNLGSTAAYSTYNSKVFLDDLNFMLGDTVKESFLVEQIRLDSMTGILANFSDQEISQRGSVKTFITTDRQSAWEVRQLLHALKGRAISFYMPSFKRDMTPVSGVLTADTALDITDVGYSDFVRERQPRNVIRLVKTDGTASDPKVITGSSKPSPGVERISISPATWGIDATLSEIERIEYVHKVRLDSDRIRMQFQDSNGVMQVGIPTREVLE